MIISIAIPIPAPVRSIAIAIPAISPFLIPEKKTPRFRLFSRIQEVGNIFYLSINVGEGAFLKIPYDVCLYFYTT